MGVKTFLFFFFNYSLFAGLSINDKIPLPPFKEIGLASSRGSAARRLKRILITSFSLSLSHPGSEERVTPMLSPSLLKIIFASTIFSSFLAYFFKTLCI